MRNLNEMMQRGRYVAALSWVERSGIPLDEFALKLVHKKWPSVRSRMIETLDPESLFFHGGQFRQAGFHGYISNNYENWPRTATGLYSSKLEVIKSLASDKASMVKLGELLELLKGFKKNKLLESTGIDGCSRCMQSPCATKTGRNAPPGSAFIFALPAWMRGFIAPTRKQALIYLDILAEEIGIAAGLSKDKHAMEDYAAGDFYINSGIRLGVLPANATRQTHKEARSNFKTASLGMLFGITPWSLSQKLNMSLHTARRFHGNHRRIYGSLHSWLELSLNEASYTNRLSSIFGWELKFNSQFMDPERSARGTALNFHIQANAAEILRLATIILVESGFDVCATVHDAILIKAPDEIADSICKDAMHLIVRATEIVLDGFGLKLGQPVIIRYPYRFYKDEDNPVWNKFCALVGIDPCRTDTQKYP